VGRTPSTEPSPKQLEAQALRAQGLTYREIGERLGITDNAVNDRLHPEQRLARRHGWPARKKAEREAQP
jgi:DNA-directed RNA polymerase specialized sigma24 family protein